MFNSPAGVAEDSSGNVYVADDLNDTIRKVTPGGVVSTLVPRGTTEEGQYLFTDPLGVAVDGAGNVYVADTFNGRIGKITPGRVVSILGGLDTSVARFDHAGDDGSGSAARFDTPRGIAVDNAGNVYVADTENEMIRRGVPPPVGQLLNISTRLGVNTGDNVLIGGFKISGSANRQVLLRALGPTLHSFGINDALVDPVLELHDGAGTLLVANDNWKDTQQASIDATGKAPSNDLEPAILRTLPPGGYTAIVRGKNNTVGVGLVEAYVVDQAVGARLTNLSTRGFVDVNQNVMIGGFICGNDVSVVVRALGPTLAQFSVPNVLADPTLELRDENGTLITSNDNWGDNQEGEIEATGLAPPGETESAVIITRPASNTTAIVHGKNNTTGNALVEAYSLN